VTVIGSSRLREGVRLLSR